MCWGSWSLREIDKNFKYLLAEKQLPELHGVEALEHHFIVHRRFLPSRTVVVTEESGGRYFGPPVRLPNTNHFTSVKPDGNKHPAHQLLLNFVLKHFGAPPAPLIP